ncbi:MAG: LicD family protein [Clostridia bacterium]|nr:LicD family protein [Clostridia bacterium]
MKELMTHEEQQRVAKNILKNFKEFCIENGLRYYLAYGTLLGAVRHKDIIPWDYDIDVFMPRPDFDKFLELTKNKDIKDKFHTFSHLNTPGYYLWFAKVCDKDTRLVITKTRSKIPLGMWIDIFPLDAIPEDIDAEKKLRKEIEDLQIKAIYPVRNDLKGIYRIAQIVRCMFSRAKSEDLLKQAHNLARQKDYEKAKAVGSFLWYETSERETIDRSYYEETTILPFGEENYAVPLRYDEILRRSYGDYMTPPKEIEEPRCFAYYINK